MKFARITEEDLVLINGILSRGSVVRIKQDKGVTKILEEKVKVIGRNVVDEDEN